MPVGHAKRVVEQVSKYVEDHMNQPLSIADIATHFFLNPDYLSRMFKKRDGLPLRRNILSAGKWNLPDAARTTQLPVNVIA